MQFKANAKQIPISPYKLRALVDVVRGKNALFALQWLSTQSLRRVLPITKVLESAVANAKDLKGIEKQDLWVKDIRVDQGRIFQYFKPGSFGRAAAQRRRFSHISVVLESKEQQPAREA